jgi:hypothetical protein
MSTPRLLGEVVARGSRSVVHAYGRGFVHVAVEHRGDSVPLIAKMSPPFDGSPDDTVGLQIIGTTHVFGEDGSRIASSRASMLSPGAVSRS